jgi:hypothetical protein
MDFDLFDFFEALFEIIGHILTSHVFWYIIVFILGIVIGVNI